MPDRPKFPLSTQNEQGDQLRENLKKKTKKNNTRFHPHNEAGSSSSSQMPGMNIKNVNIRQVFSMLRCINLKDSKLGHLVTDASRILETTSTESFAIRFAQEVLESKSFEEESEEISTGVKLALQALKTISCPAMNPIETGQNRSATLVVQNQPKVVVENIKKNNAPYSLSMQLIRDKYRINSQV